MLQTLLLVALFGQVAAQNVKPQIGYVYPPGGPAGTTVEVMLGAYDWTPDMQVFSHDPRVKIEITGMLGEPILTPPPYWFGQKAGLAQPPLPREVAAKFTIPAEVSPGPIRWQVANANGGSNVGTFVIGESLEVIEPEKRGGPIDLPSLPVTVSGRISRITEIDSYRFTIPAAGLIVCRLDDRLGQPFNGVLAIQDAAGKLVTDAADTTGEGATVMFTALAGATYTASVRDADHAGDRGYVYRLSIERRPHVLAAVPVVVARGQTTAVEVIGWGVASGVQKLESVMQSIAIPNQAADTYRYAFDTPAGRAQVTLAVDAAADTIEPASKDVAARQLSVPTRLTGVLDQLDPASQMPLDRFQITVKKADMLRLAVEAARFHSPVDPSIAVVDSEGKEIVRNDDLPASTDAAVDFKAPADGVYTVIVSDLSGVSPSRASVYRLVVENPAEVADFTLTIPDRLDIPLGGSADLIAKPVRRGSWDDAIELKLVDLPEGVSIPETPPPPPMPMPGVRKPPVRKAAPGDIKVSLVAAADAPAGAKLATVVASATVGERTIEKKFGPLLVTTTLKTRCKVKSAVQDGGRIVNRGTTYPADVIIERLEDYTGPIMLQMASTQQRQRRGIRGGEMLVPAGVDQVRYPVFMPEWLETSLTARINVIGVAQVPDPKGNIRHVTGIMDGLIVMSLEGALLKISHEPQERAVSLGGTIDIPVKVSRTVRLQEPAKVEVVADAEFPGLFAAEPVTLAPGQSSAIVKLRVSAEPRAAGERRVVIRATALQNGRWPAVSETGVPVMIERR